MEIEARKGHWSFLYVNEVEIKAQKAHWSPLYVYDVWKFCKENCQNPINFINYSYHNYYC